MKAITTQYRPATECKPARVIATEPDGRSAIVRADVPTEVGGRTFEAHEAHHAAVAALCAALDWTGELVAGDLNGRRVWVWLPPAGHSDRLTIGG